MKARISKTLHRVKQPKIRKCKSAVPSKIRNKHFKNSHQTLNETKVEENTTVTNGAEVETKMRVNSPSKNLDENFIPERNDLTKRETVTSLDPNPSIGDTLILLSETPIPQSETHAVAESRPDKIKNIKTSPSQPKTRETTPHQKKITLSISPLKIKTPGHTSPMREAPRFPLASHTTPTTARARSSYCTKNEDAVARKHSDGKSVSKKKSALKQTETSADGNQVHVRVLKSNPDARVITFALPVDPSPKRAKISTSAVAGGKDFGKTKATPQSSANSIPVSHVNLSKNANASRNHCFGKPNPVLNKNFASTRFNSQKIDPRKIDVYIPSAKSHPKLYSPKSIIKKKRNQKHQQADQKINVTKPHKPADQNINVEKNQPNEDEDLNINKQQLAEQNLNVNTSQSIDQKLSVNKQPSTEQKLNVNKSQSTYQKLNVNKSQFAYQKLNVNKQPSTEQKLNVNKSQSTDQKLNANKSQSAYQKLNVNKSQSTDLKLTANKKQTTSQKPTKSPLTLPVELQVTTPTASAKQEVTQPKLTPSATNDEKLLHRNKPQHITSKVKSSPDLLSSGEKRKTRSTSKNYPRKTTTVTNTALKLDLTETHPQLTSKNSGGDGQVKLEKVKAKSPKQPIKKKHGLEISETVGKKVTKPNMSGRRLQNMNSNNGSSVDSESLPGINIEEASENDVKEDPSSVLNEETAQAIVDPEPDEVTVKPKKKKKLKRRIKPKEVKPKRPMFTGWDFDKELQKHSMNRLPREIEITAMLLQRAKKLKQLKPPRTIEANTSGLTYPSQMHADRDDVKIYLAKHGIAGHFERLTSTLLPPGYGPINSLIQRERTLANLNQLEDEGNAFLTAVTTKVAGKPVSFPTVSKSSSVTAVLASGNIGKRPSTTATVVSENGTFKSFDM
ncbi:uncharacterized protein LOC131953130 [Physella acuta]|uniref:uncharacterized protein LOC131953130 n=1 Tax=Physella acuta TaxID=109671 RepID=UPI0027DE3550|nr:uncharacterized protein LOC131953130 [Physella acuta]